MKTIQVLDCTLRDGGYCNQWKFGFNNTKKIINSLIEANIDIIECGFLTNTVIYQCDITRFNTIQQLAKIIPKERSGKSFVAMINYGEYTIEDIPKYDGSSIDGIRIAFYKNNLQEALKLAEGIKDKGYKVFIQPMLTLDYSDEEFLILIKQMNKLKPYAFYIVDSFGMMKRKDLIRLYYLIEHNLDENIWIGFHSHNNMQLAYSNSQNLVDSQSGRSLIIDSSVFGMGRGAGNLNTELFIEYLNDNLEQRYYLQPLLKVIDEVLNKFYQENYWGYSLPNYLSAAYRTHPNYAMYLNDKNTLTIENMYEIFSMMADEKRTSYNQRYIEELYNRYMSKEKVYDNNFSKFMENLLGKTVLIIAPGKSVEDEKDKVVKFANEPNVISISINFNYPHIDTDYIFLSNLRRYREFEGEKRKKMIVTSNIPADGVYLKIKYADLTNHLEAVKDNAGMMLIKYLINVGVKDIVLAGMDGYSHEISENYASYQMTLITRNAILDAMNKGMSEMLKIYSKEIKIQFLTEKKHVKI